VSPCPGKDFSTENESTPSAFSFGKRRALFSLKEGPLSFSRGRFLRSQDSLPGAVYLLPFLGAESSLFPFMLARLENEFVESFFLRKKV